MTDPSTPAPSEPFHKSGKRQSFAVVAWIGFWILAQTLLLRWQVNPQHQVMVFVALSAAFLAAAFLAARGWTLELFSSVPFAITQMAFLGGAVLLGTLLLQEESAATYQALYGGRFLGIPLALVKHAHAGDLYRSLWFYGLLLLICVSTLCVAWMKRPYPMHRVGFLLVHIAPTLILLGGLWGKFSGVRAFSELRQGQPTSTFFRMKDRGFTDPIQLPGFQVRLDQFRVDRYDPEFKLYAFVQPDGKGGFEKNPRAYDVKQGMKASLPLSGCTLEVEQLLPNAVNNGSLFDNPKGRVNPVLEVMLGLGTKQPVGGHLFSQVPQLQRRDEPGGRFAVVYLDSLSPEILAGLKTRPPKEEKLVMAFMGRTLEHPVKVGITWDFPVFSLHVVKLHPDFPFKQGPKGPIILDQLPPSLRGPWVELKLRTQDGQESPLYLSARNPAFSAETNAKILPPGMVLGYLRAGEEIQKRYVVFTRDDQKVRLVENGVVKRTEDMVIRKPFVVEKGLSATPVTTLERADYSQDFVQHPDAMEALKFDHPVLKVRVVDPKSGTSESHWLEAFGPDGRPMPGMTFLDGRVGLVYKRKDTEPKDFRSNLVILDMAGQELTRKEISVNDPLVFRGWWFYQSNYNPQDPTVSGIMTLHEPGLYLTYLGFACLIIGILWMFYLKPRLKKAATRKEV